MRILLKFARAIDRLIEVLGQGTDWLVILTVAVGFYNVAVRYIGRFIGLQLSSNILIELQWYLFSIIFLLGFAYILKHDQNVRVDFWYAHWSERRKTWINLIGTLFFLIPFCSLGLYVALNPVLASWGQLPDGTWGSWEVSSDANGLPRAPIKTMLLVGLALLLLQAIAQAIKYAALLLGRPVNVQQDAEQLPYE
ncbi:TRAP transporter small permease subunit [Oculatella sp. FACHB-28]|uniref:TRAP transporter small permease subunit n=1 Tax=Oculatella sp. FACHB-28 TaxID=2692845 RepID=UPI0016834840|nr:TRAP transporter small permease subunit [Oculatella sp. FACHB-28]MBD1867083.1 TRAP transporter small permease subunit [Cyanobacteria bacterium FACHB-471]MBD2057526.1 TRAP transporter small permease subunit [Oculatella sp. FACHB-28]